MSIENPSGLNPGAIIVRRGRKEYKLSKRTHGGWWMIREELTFVYDGDLISDQWAEKTPEPGPWLPSIDVPKEHWRRCGPDVEYEPHAWLDWLPAEKYGLYGNRVGQESRGCRDCHKIEWRPIVHEHKWGDPHATISFSRPTAHVRECDCGEERWESHDFGAWQESSSKYREYHRCSICRFVEWRTTPTAPPETETVAASPDLSEIPVLALLIELQRRTER